jgi:hypothetical protein
MPGVKLVEAPLGTVHPVADSARKTRADYWVPWSHVLVVLC